MKLCLKPAVVLWPPSTVAGSRWQVEDAVDRRRFAVSPLGAAVLVAAAAPTSIDDLRAMLSRHADTPAVDAAIDAMRRTGLLLEWDRPMGQRLDRYVTARSKWSGHGWTAAADYHLLTYDYPCYDYASDGYREDRARMRRYHAEEPDLDRVKLDFADLPGVPLPPAAEVRGRRALGAAFGPADGSTPLRLPELAAVVALTFGEIGELPMHPPTPPMLRRTSPSGGARHPSEGYVAAIDVPGLDPGWYHVTMRPFGLRRLPVPPPEPAEVRHLFRSATVEPSVAAVLVITSVFARNMYRYREPRTFRTVHMDAGHLAGTAQLVAADLGLRAHVSFADQAVAVERRLGLDGMTEGQLASVALGGDPTTTPPGGEGSRR